MYCMVSWTVLGIDCNLCVNIVDDARLQYADENNNSLIWNAACHPFFFVCQHCKTVVPEWFIFPLMFDDVKVMNFATYQSVIESLNLAVASIGGSHITSFYC